MKVSAVVPTLNEEENIGDVLREVSNYVESIFVVDGFSEDSTKEISESFNSVNFFRAPSGKGRGLRLGFQKALEEKSDFVVMIDGDGEKNPEDIEKMLELAVNENLDVVFGTRKWRDMRSKFREMCNIIGSIAINIQVPGRVKDPFSGFNLIKTDALRKLDLRSDNFEIETELVLKSFENNFKVGTVDVRTENFSESKFTPRNFLEIANFYGEYVNENINYKDSSLSKKVFNKSAYLFVKLFSSFLL